MAVMFGRNVKKNSTASRETVREMPPSVHRNTGVSPDGPPISKAAQEQRRLAERRRIEKQRAMRGAAVRPAQATSARPAPQGSDNMRRAGAVQRKRPIPNGKRRTPRAVPIGEKKPKIRMSKPRDRQKWFLLGTRFDYPFFFIVMIMIGFGLVMLFSASYAVAYNSKGDSFYYLKRQLIFLGIGFAAMIGVSLFNYELLRTKVVLIGITLFSTALMLFVKVGGTTLGGSERWITIGEITIQPSEILKLAVIIILAYYLELKYENLGDFKTGFIPAAVIIVFACGLVAIQPHISGTIIIFVLALTLLLVGGAKVSHILLLIVAAAIGAVLLLTLLNALGFSYFEARLLSFQDPEADIQKDTFQTYQSLLAIGSGGVFGLGLGNSRQKYLYLPAAQNDFIFSIICEELGIVGAVFVILLFVVFVARGFYIAVKSVDKFGMLIAVGISVQIGLQALMNIAVACNAMPNTGISLPFFSYGGTALILQMAEMGLVLSVSRKAAID